ncbi:hypothetical protein [Kineosporia succinea]|uniref:Uncharacterized protein n=1 Tax=Kineosporia succinea TaxID=84632 RepID=A0ABT9PAH2_9ACTN|nr:hypothetical protein [Kineosporia succinea]MDP9829702.1 hypothetical protein [Kineosporia succinea]
MRRPTAEDAVVALITVPMSASVVWNVGGHLLPGLLNTAQDRGFSPALLALSVALAVAGVWVQVLFFAGPVAASAAQLQWLPTGDVLGHQHLLTWAAASAVVVVLVALAVLTARAMGWPLAPVALSTALVLVTAVVMTLWLQKRDAPALVGLVAAALVIAALTLAAGQAWSTPTGVAVGLGATVATAIQRRPSGFAAPRANPVVPRWQLTRAHTNRWSVNAGILALDGDIVQAVHERQGPATRSAMPAFVFRTRRPVAVSVVVLWRAMSGGLLGAAGLVLTALVADRLLGPGAALVLLVVLQYGLALAVARVGESWLMSPALQRIWGRGALVAGMFAPVLGVGAGVTVLAAATVGASPVAGLVLLITGPLVLGRRHLARRSTGLTLVSTPAGPLPLQTFDRTVAGYDVLVVAALLVLSL